MADVLRETACGMFGGLLSSCVTYPLDTVKVRVQTGTSVSVRQCAAEIFRMDGIRGFYRGISMQAIQSAIYIGSAFGGLSIGYRLYDALIDQSYSEHDGLDVQRTLISGGVAGVVCGVCITPGARTPFVALRMPCHVRASQAV